MDYKTWLARQATSHNDEKTRKQAAALQKYDGTTNTGLLENIGAKLNTGYSKDSLIQMDKNFTNMWLADVAKNRAEQAEEAASDTGDGQEDFTSVVDQATANAYNAQAAAAARARAQAEAEAKAKEEKAKADSRAQYDEEIRQAQDALGRLGNQQSIGEANIRKSGTDARTSADNDFSRATGLYNMNTEDAIAGNRTARDRIEADAADKVRTARSIFGAGGAGDSSFSKILAPFKVTEAATKQQGEVQDAYAKNRRDMDINYTDVQNAYNDNKKKIEDTQDSRLNELKQKILSARSDLENRIRQANINKSTVDGSSLAGAIASQNAARDQINRYAGEIDNLGRDVSIPINKVEWKAPDLQQYKPTDVTVQQTDNGIGGVNDQIASNLQPILGEDKKKKEELGWI